MAQDNQKRTAQEDELRMRVHDFLEAYISESEHEGTDISAWDFAQYLEAVTAE